MIKRFFQPAYLLIGLYAIAGSILAFLFDGTGDDGDSLHHFLYAQAAFSHPENFFNHWAKPLYVLFMAPWAQLGFTAVKLVNVALLALSMVFTVKIADLMGLKPRYLPLLFMLTAPATTYLALSGLTEPMFVFWLVYGLLLAFQNRPVPATIWLSFLPFVRSEGLVILCVFAVYLVLKQHWKLLPLLASGHVFYMLAGFPIYGDLLWVFNQIPYATMDSVGLYGIGKWTHYMVLLPEVYGSFIALFLAAGLLFGLYRLLIFFRKKSDFSKEEIWLVYGVFVAYFAAHTIFWANGMFKSFGLLRVMLCVLPMVGLICGRLAALLWSKFNGKPQQFALAASYLLLAAWGMYHEMDWTDKLHLTGSQKAHEALAEKYGAALKEGDYTVYFDAVHPAIALDIDIFSKKKKYTTRLFDGSPVPARSAVIWDNRFSLVDAQIPLSRLVEDPRFNLVDSFLDYEKYGVYLFFTTDSFARYSSVLAWEDFEKKDIEGSLPAPAKDRGYAFQLDKNHQFSKGISARVSDFVDREKVLLSFDAFAPQVPENYAGIVVSYESKAGKMLDYTFSPIRDLAIKAETWQAISRSIVVKTAEFPEAELKIYLWNPTDAPLFLDNLKIEFVD